MGVIEQLIVDVRTWRSLVAARLELPTPSPEHRLTSGGAGSPGRSVAARMGSHPPQAA
jgi:hypothetical protein